MPYTKISEADELNIIKDNYENRLSLNQIQKKYHVSAARINKIFAKYGVEIKKNIHKGKYSFNRDFFFRESADLAYFLGWVSSDGFIQTGANVIGIEIKESDKQVLEDIRNAMQYTRPLLDIYRKERGNGHFCKFILENQEIKQLLINKYGIIPNKSSDLSFCFNFSNLNKDFWKDYIRGYFDGDGCIKMTGQSLTFQIDCTSLKMLLAIEDALKQLDSTINLSITQRFPKENEDQNDESLSYSEKIQSKLSLFRLYCYGKDAKKVFKLLYDDANIYLKRKYDRYLQYMK